MIPACFYMQGFHLMEILTSYMKIPVFAKIDNAKPE